jgi:hypothetical protein
MLIMGIVVNGLQKAAVAAAAAPKAAGAAAKRVRPGTRVQRALEADSLLAHMVTDFDRLRVEGTASAAHPPWAAFVAKLSDASAFQPLGAAPPAGATMGDLARKLDELQLKVDAQDKQIAALKKKRG